MLSSRLYTFLSLGCTCLCTGKVTASPIASTTRDNNDNDGDSNDETDVTAYVRRRRLPMTIQSSRHPSGTSYQRSRLLEETSEFGVQLFLDLQFLGDEAATQMESGDVNTEAIQRFCSAVEKQVTGDIVQTAAEDFNASVSVNADGNFCSIVGTSRIYDPEAVDLHGEGFVSFQVQVLQWVNVTSSHFLWLEKVTEIVQNGFSPTTGGHSEFLDELHQSLSLFASVSTVKLRGGLAPPRGPPSASPTSAPTQIPTVRPTHLVTSTPTRQSTIQPSELPTDRRSPGITDGPSSSPSILPTARTASKSSAFPTSLPTAMGTVRSTNVPTFLPTASPSDNVVMTSPTMDGSIYPSVEPTRTTKDPTTVVPHISPTKQPTTAPVATNAPLNSIPINGSSSPGSTDEVVVGGASSVQKAGRPLRDDPIAIAAILGGVITICVFCLFMLCMRKRRKVRREERHPKMKLTDGDGQLNHPSDVFVPGVVELDQQSLADTTLGEHTAGRPRRKKKKVPREVLHHLDSFEEGSLYTTPFSQQHDDDGSLISGRRRQNSPSSALSNQIAKPSDYSGNILFPLSDTNTDSSDGIHSSSGPTSGRGGTFFDNGPLNSGIEVIESSFRERRKLGPIDLDTHKPYRGPADVEFRDFTKGPKPFHTDEKKEITFDPNEDNPNAWDGDFKAFQDNPKAAVGRTSSRSPSHSSKSTAKTANVSSKRKLDPTGTLPPVLATEEESLDSGSWDGAEEKDQDQDQDHGSGYEAELQPESESESIQSGAYAEEGSIQELYKDLLADNQSLEQSLQSSNSVQSKQSTSSQNSRKTHSGQQPPFEEGFKKRSGSLASLKVDLDGASNTSEESPTSLRRRLRLADLPTAPSPHDGPDGSFPKKNSNRASYTAVVTHHEELKDASDIDTEVGDQNPTGTGPSKDDRSATSGASASTTTSPWLFDAVEQTLGPRSVTADMESLGGKSNLSVMSPSNKSKSGKGPESVTSLGSRLSYRSGLTHSEISFTPKTFEHDIKRLEMQLAALDNSDQHTTTSSVTGASHTGGSFSTLSTRKRTPKISKHKRIVVLVPAGKLGVVLADSHDGKGAVVSDIRKDSKLRGMLSRGDRLVAIDGEDVTKLFVREITSLMSSKALQERRLTILTSIPQQQRQQQQIKKGKIVGSPNKSKTTSRK